MAELDVIKQALRNIGANDITSRTDGSHNADVVDDIYDDVRDNLLRAHPWNFATKRAQLTQDATAPTFEFDYAYDLPADWLRTISVHNNDAGLGTFLHRMEQIDGTNAIVTSATEVYLRYVHQVSDTTLMPPDFRVALEFALARDLAIPLTGSRSLRQEMREEFKSAMAQARSTDALGASPELRPRGSWASSRAGNRGHDYLSD